MRHCRLTRLLFSHYHIWRWRDWIIESLNAGIGYDQMVMAMLAGDEIAPEDPNTLRATGYLARNWETFNRNKWLDTTIEHTSRAFFGVTLQCARCHDHKFDPISQDDYYRFRAIFEPYHIRIDRVPGQPDRVKDGVVRAFDDFIETPTHVFVRGDETHPDTSRQLVAGVPVVFGGSLLVQPIALPVSAIDPDNHYYWRMNPRRMEAEVIRDSLLHLAGRLDSTRGGPPLPVAAAEGGPRRTVYYHHARDEGMLFLTLFDGPSVEECYRRHETIVPQQALALANSKLAFDRAEEIARVVSDLVGDGSTADFVVAAFEHVLGRAPSEAERSAASEGLARLTAVECADAASPNGGADACAAGGAEISVREGAAPRERARAAFIHVLFNHNDFVTIR